MSCLVCGEQCEEINEDELCLEYFNDDKYELEYSNPICITCAKSENDLISNMYCLDCWKRQRFLHIFSESSIYTLGAYFGKHLLEKYLGYYVSENDFIIFMKKNDFKFNEKKGTFRTKINKKKALEILGIKV